jgi:hypothetical protein
MWRLRSLLEAKASIRALDANAAGAGSALACAFSSSAEYEAAIIAARRAAGVYGPKRQHRHLLLAALALSVMVALVAVALQF